MWHGRFKGGMAESVKDFTQSLDIDWRMAECDIQGSIAHVKMLGATGLLKTDEAEKIEKYDYADDDDVMKISSRLIEKHRKAYMSLANA